MMRNVFHRFACFSIAILRQFISISERFWLALIFVFLPQIMNDGDGKEELVSRLAHGS